MSILTQREKEIMRLLKEGVGVREISRRFKVSQTSISRSITNIKRKIRDMEEDMMFLQDIGFLKITNGGFEFISEDRDPKMLLKPRD